MDLIRAVGFSTVSNLGQRAVVMQFVRSNPHACPRSPASTASTASTSLTARVEQLLREAIASGRFGEGPTQQADREVEELARAAWLSTTAETVRLAAKVLQREGLARKDSPQGTFIRQPDLPEKIEPRPSTAASGLSGSGIRSAPPVPSRDRVRSRGAGCCVVSGLMCFPGAMEEAGRAGFHPRCPPCAPHTQLGKAFPGTLTATTAARRLIIGSYGEEKLLRRVFRTWTCQPCCSITTTAPVRHPLGARRFLPGSTGRLCSISPSWGIAVSPSRTGGRSSLNPFLAASGLSPGAARRRSAAPAVVGVVGRTDAGWGR